MPKRKTTSQFITDAKSVHGSKYSYKQTNYRKSNEKVKIYCYKHGHFMQVASSHLMGRGCPECANEQLKNEFTSNTNEFITKAIEQHGTKYDYSNVEYCNSKTKVDIYCPHHGLFRQTPGHHIHGQGCPNCASNVTLTTEEFIDRSNIVHNNKYDYSVANYTNAYTEIRVICPKHGLFSQLPVNHMRGNGCYECGIESSTEYSINNPIGWDYSKWKKAAESSKYFDSFKVYIIKCYNDDEQFYKIGRTFRSLNDRFCSVKRMPYNYDIIKIITSKDAKKICVLEHKLKKRHSRYKYKPMIHFPGESECFTKIIS